MDKEKMVQIYEVMADITLNSLNEIKESGGVPGEDTLEMVRTTQSLYETLNHANHPANANIADCNRKSQYGCNYTDRPDIK